MNSTIPPGVEQPANSLRLDLPEVDCSAAFAVVENKLRRLIEDHPDQIPVYTEAGRWHLDSDGWAPVWTSGFLAGMLWALADHTSDPYWRRAAERYCLLFEDRKNDTNTHDIGFLFTTSWDRWYQKTQSPQQAEVLVAAARSLASNYNPAGAYIRTWVDPGSSFIDIMMNLDILYRGAELSGDDDLAQMATSHALTARRYLVRGDATTAHEGWFDPASGEFLHAATHQGWRRDSAWARGLTWAIYGFGDCFRRTQDQRFLQTATSCADAYIQQVGEGLITANDWDEPEPALAYESSAACVAAAGMLQLAQLTNQDGEKYAVYGARILGRLTDPEFLAYEEDWDGIIKHAIYHQRNGLGVDESVMWGDYYFVEALERYQRLARR